MSATQLRYKIRKYCDKPRLWNNSVTTHKQLYCMSQNVKILYKYIFNIFFSSVKEMKPFDFRLRNYSNVVFNCKKKNSSYYSVASVASTPCPKIIWTRSNSTLYMNTAAVYWMKKYRTARSSIEDICTYIFLTLRTLGINH